MTKESNKLNKQKVGKKIHKGRAKGTPNKLTATMREMAQPYGAKALTVLRKLMKSDSEQIRLAAAKEIKEWGYGKSHQVTESKIDQTVKVDVTDVELARRAAFILAKADHASTEPLPVDPEPRVTH